MLLVVVAAGIATAAGNRVANGDFETVGADPLDTPAWTTDTGRAAQLPLLGVDNTTAELLLGPAVVRSALFAVTAGETLTLTADVFEIRDDSDGRPNWRGDSVVAIEFVTLNGGSMRQLEFHCDAYVDLLDNDKLDESDTCTATDGYVPMTSGQTTLTCSVVNNAECAKYRDAIVVPAGAVRARILLGGSLATDTIDPLLTGVGLDSPTTLTAFDNVIVS
ncbi:MAG TPA: hypothetical protein VM370_10895 [Candidatus Thermoplasmatota archaeon]|nr:hypothetical protein [Candidatus Thermoplasmatota archaeon]